MKIEEQVTNLELSKRLKELGVKQESLFWWQPSEYQMRIVGTPNRKKWSEEHIFSAFTVAELGEMLPWYFSSEKHTNDWRVGFANAKGKHENVPVVYANTEADARAKMLIYLIENNLLI